MLFIKVMKQEYLRHGKNVKNKLKDILNLYLKNLKLNKNNLVCPDKKIEIDYIDYYYSNVIARASKTMHECKQTRKKFLKTGTEE